MPCPTRVRYARAEDRNPRIRSARPLLPLLPTMLCALLPLGRALFAVILGFSVTAQACALVAGMTFRRDALARALRSQAVTAGSAEVTLRDVVARHPERAPYVFTMPPHGLDPTSTHEAGSVVAQSTPRGRTRATAEATSNQLNL